jgi:predicted PurR-regulated permease PerM
MDVIPFARFFLALFGSGLMLLIFNPLMSLLQAMFPIERGSSASTIIFMLWTGVTIVILLAETITLFRSLQARKGIE